MSQETNRPQVSAIIRCFNEEKHIGRLLSGLIQQTVEDLEIVVVDSGSTDATLSIVSQFDARIVRIQPDTFSFGYSLNRGCRAATGDIIVIASAHVYPIHKDWIEHLIKPFSNERIALTYGMQRGNEITRYSENAVFQTWFPEKASPLQDHPFCNNANAAIRRSVWEQFAYNESLTGLEDLDWAQRVMAAGHLISYVPDAVIVHVHEEAYRQIYSRYRREAIAMKAIYPDRKFGLFSFLRFFTSNVLSDYYHAIRDSALFRNVFSIMLFRLMQFGGTFRGFAQHRPISGTIWNKFYYPKEIKPRKETGNELVVRETIDYSRTQNHMIGNDQHESRSQSDNS